MIGVVYQGRLGNNLFQYAFARIQAEDHGVPYSLTLPENGVVRSIDTGATPWDGKAYQHVKENLGGPWVPPDISGSEYNVVYEGYFQRWEYFAGQRDRVRGYYTYSKPESRSSKDVCLHLRLTDYHEIPAMIKPPEMYGSVVDRIYDGKLVIVTDDPKDGYLDYFLERYPNVEVLSGSAQEDFCTLMSFDNLVVSNSTFSWWAAYLGESRNIFIPEDFGVGSASVGLYNLGFKF